MSGYIFNPTVLVPAVIFVGSYLSREVFFPSPRPTYVSLLIKKTLAVANISLERLQDGARMHSNKKKHVICALTDNLWYTTLFWGLAVSYRFGKNTMLTPEIIGSTVSITIVASTCIHLARSSLARALPYTYGRLIAPSYTEVSGAAGEHDVSLTRTSAPLTRTLSAPHVPEEYADDAVISELIDPITQAPINVAVRSRNNRAIVFDRASIEAHIRYCQAEGRSAFCPVSRAPITLEDLEPAAAEQGIINRRVLRLNTRVAKHLTREAASTQGVN